MAQTLMLVPLVLLVLGTVDAARHGRPRSDDMVKCGRHTCGVGAQCNHEAKTSVCACLPGYSGDALSTCVKTKCASNRECLSNQYCVNKHCADPCVDTCGTNAKCSVRNHVPVCSCPPGYTGDPYSSC